MLFNRFFKQPKPNTFGYTPVYYDERKIERDRKIKEAQLDKEEFVPSIFMENVIDTTGCGDSFAGGLAYGLMDGGDNFIRSAMYANALGAQRTQGTTFEVFKSLQETEDMMKSNYLDFQ